MNYEKVAKKIAKEYSFAYDINPDEQEYLEQIIIKVLQEEKSNT